MKRFLRGVLNFLERKFPDKVEVTLERYTQLGATIAAQAEQLIKQEERIKALEMNVLNLNQAIGFAAPKMGMLER